MASLNRVQIIGRLGKDPELRYTNNGAGICNMTVATDESYTDTNGQKVQQTEWHRVTAFQKLADLCANYLHKGSQVYVEGSLNTRKWQDQQGQDRFTTEIKAQRVLFLDGRQADAQHDAPTQQPRQMRQQQMVQDTTPDNVPF